MVVVLINGFHSLQAIASPSPVCCICGLDATSTHLQEHLAGPVVEVTENNNLSWSEHTSEQVVSNVVCSSAEVPSLNSLSESVSSTGSTSMLFNSCKQTGITDDFNFINEEDSDLSNEKNTPDSWLLSSQVVNVQGSCDSRTVFEATLSNNSLSDLVTPSVTETKSDNVFRVHTSIGRKIEVFVSSHELENCIGVDQICSRVGTIAEPHDHSAVQQEIVKFENKVLISCAECGSSGKRILS